MYIVRCRDTIKSKKKKETKRIQKVNHSSIQKCQYARYKKGQGRLHMVHSIVVLIGKKLFQKIFRLLLARDKNLGH
jgi:hypothetical protein